MSLGVKDLPSLQFWSCPGSRSEWCGEPYGHVHHNPYSGKFLFLTDLFIEQLKSLLDMLQQLHIGEETNFRPVPPQTTSSTMIM